MARSLQPGTGGPAPAVAETPRRNVLVAALAAICGSIVALFPVAGGLVLFLDPILKRKPASEGGEGGKPFRRVANVEMLPADGTPVQVPVIADLTDAWNREANQPVGAVYLRKTASGVECFNAICPHAGCFVGYSADRKVFQCPCHTSSFRLDGERILPSPSPRNMDALKVDETKLPSGEVWVQFVNYYPGKEQREEKPG